MQIPVVKFGPLNPLSSPTLVTLHEGQLLKGFVQSKDGNTVVLNLAGMKISSQTELEVSAGQPLWLEAVEVKPERVLFKLVDGQKITLKEFPNKIPDSIFTKLGILPSPPAAKAIEILMSYDLPIFKGLVEEILVKLPDEVPPDKLEVLIHTIVLLKSKKLPVTGETEQLLLIVFSGESDPEEVVYALKLLNEAKSDQLPNLYYVWWQNEFHQGEIYLWREQRQNKEKQGSCQVVVHFFTQYLGELWVKLNHFGDKLNLSLVAEKPTAVTLFREHLEKLEALLHASGYQLGAVECHAGRVDSVFTFTQEKVTREYRGIDLKV